MLSELTRNGGDFDGWDLSCGAASNLLTGEADRFLVSIKFPF